MTPDDTAHDAPDPRQAAARYLVDRLGAADDEEAGEDPGAGGPPRMLTAADRAAVVEQSIQQAIRRGEFDDLPGAGKPLQGLDRSNDPDWWIRRKIETEQLSGLAPPALALRVENEELTERLDGLGREEDVREALEDFNHRVRQARLQLQGGPPVVTPLREVDAEVAAWRERRAERARRAAAERAEGEQAARRPWWRRG